MKLLCGLLLSILTSISFAGYTDGFITPGEYESNVNWLSGLLVVDGGGAESIEVHENARIEVKSTSIPDDNWKNGGILHLALTGQPNLDYYGGITWKIWIRNHSTAKFYGGNISYITSMWYPTGAGPDIEIHCQDGWSWLANDPLLGIEGLWQDGSTFRIEFINDVDYDPVWMNINVITPEPATLVLLSFGVFQLRQRK